MSNEFEEIASRIEARGATRPCAACGHEKFGMNPGWVQLEVEAKRTEKDLGGPAVPTVVLFCNNCGLVRLHAPAVLGM